MSEDMLCDVCPWFGPCHVGDDIPDGACWNDCRDAGLPFVYPAPAAVPAPAPVRATRAPKPPKSKVGRPREPEREDLARLAAVMAERGYRPSTIQRNCSSLRRIPRDALEDLARSAESLDPTRRYMAQIVRIYRELLLGVTRPPPSAPEYREKAEATKYRRIVDACGGREPPVPLPIMATRPDLWEYAERLLANGMAPDRTKEAIWYISRIPEETLTGAEPAIRVAERLTPTNSAISHARTAICIRRYRKVMGATAAIDPGSYFGPAELVVLETSATPEIAWDRYREAFPRSPRGIAAVLQAWGRNHGRGGVPP